MDEMDDYYRNKISLCPKYIEWTRLSDKSEMFYCNFFYRKPVDEIKLLAHIKRTIVANDRATQKRKKQKLESPPNDELPGGNNGVIRPGRCGAQSAVLGPEGCEMKFSKKY